MNKNSHSESKQISYTQLKHVQPRLREASTAPSSSISASTSRSKSASTHKVSAGTKRARIDSLAETDSNKLIDMAAARQEYKIKALDVKRQKYAVEAERERYAAEDRAVVVRERMMEKEHQRQQEREEHERKMMQYQIQLLQLQQQSSISSHSPMSPNHALYIDTGSTTNNLTTTGLNNFGFRSEGMTFPHTSEQSPYPPNKFFNGQQRF